MLLTYAQNLMTNLTSVLRFKCIYNLYYIICAETKDAEVKDAEVKDAKVKE